MALSLSEISSDLMTLYVSKCDIHGHALQVVDLGAIPIGVASLEITLATGGSDLDIQL
jgi:hypothetical protein